MSRVFLCFLRSEEVYWMCILSHSLTNDYESVILWEYHKIQQSLERTRRFTMYKLIKILFAALVLIGLIFVSPATPVQAGGCLYPQQYNADEYYAYPRGLYPDLDKACDESNPGSAPGYRIDDYNKQVACESSKGLVTVPVAKCKLMRLRASFGQVGTGAVVR